MDLEEAIKYMELEAASPHDKPIGLHGHITDTAMALYVEKACPDFEPEIQNHLATCTTCQQDLDGLRAALADDRAHPERLEASVERVVAIMESRRATKQ